MKDVVCDMIVDLPHVLIRRVVVNLQVLLVFLSIQLDVVDRLGVIELDLPPSWGLLYLAFLFDFNAVQALSGVVKLRHEVEAGGFTLNKTLGKGVNRFLEGVLVGVSYWVLGMLDIFVKVEGDGGWLGLHSFGACNI